MTTDKPSLHCDSSRTDDMPELHHLDQMPNGRAFTLNFDRFAQLPKFCDLDQAQSPTTIFKDFTEEPPDFSQGSTASSVDVRTNVLEALDVSDKPDPRGLCKTPERRLSTSSDGSIERTTGDNKDIGREPLTGFNESDDLNNGTKSDDPWTNMKSWDAKTMRDHLTPKEADHSLAPDDIFTFWVPTKGPSLPFMQTFPETDAPLKRDKGKQRAEPVFDKIKQSDEAERQKRFAEEEERAARERIQKPQSSNTHTLLDQPDSSDLYDYSNPILEAHYTQSTELDDTEPSTHPSQENTISSQNNPQSYKHSVTSDDIHEEPATSAEREAFLKENNRFDLAKQFEACLTFEPSVNPAQSTQAIAQYILETYSFQPWYSLRSLDLSNQNLTQVHNLKAICPRLESLILSNNAIANISGLPPSLLRVTASTNRLTDATGFRDLTNLQHLDVCNNAICSFEDIGHLCHLRTLHAENNKLRSCSGFWPLAGLIDLNLRNNAIRRLKFKKNAMPLLEKLDVSFNRIESMDSIESQTSLRELNMEHNELHTIYLTEQLERLKVLRLSYNRLRNFEGKWFPDLSVLYLDDNKITNITGLSGMPRLTKFSLRDQGGHEVNIHMPHMRGARNIYLSGNQLKSLDGIVDFFSLTYLEMCAIQLHELPQDFHLQVPNLGALYLNHNHLKDIQPLRHLRHLQKLAIIGNQLKHMTSIIETVRTMTRLWYLDLRQNPLNVKLYPRVHYPKCINNGSSHRMMSRHLTYEFDNTWISRDDHFCRALPQVLLDRRSVYRAFLIEYCQNLSFLDGIYITDGEVQDAANQMARLQKKSIPK